MCTKFLMHICIFQRPICKLHAKDSIQSMNRTTFFLSDRVAGENYTNLLQKSNSEFIEFRMRKVHNFLESAL
jgi:hypothetical protein